MIRKTSKRKLKVGIIRFPCSNCDFDTLKFFKKFGHDAFFIWYKESKLSKIDLLVLPGGFAFGDRVYKKATGKYVIDPGEQAISSPVMNVVSKAAEKKIPILGICNGFQILVKAGFLPGKLLQNKSKKFFCDFVSCKITGDSFFHDKNLIGKIFRIPVAHGYGRYVIGKTELTDLKKNNQIFLKYQGFNPNGSIGNIAGVTNEYKNIYGLMPHPERSKDGKYFIKAIEKYVG
ncbi:MAG: phosphoribosylformylglycinamidine synthase I [Patescibacteria group bacterium]